MTAAATPAVAAMLGDDPSDLGQLDHLARRVTLAAAVGIETLPGVPEAIRIVIRDHGRVGRQLHRLALELGSTIRFATAAAM
jgi:hypothetical protein